MIIKGRIYSIIIIHHSLHRHRTLAFTTESFIHSLVDLKTSSSVPFLRHRSSLYCKKAWAQKRHFVTGKVFVYWCFTVWINFHSVLTRLWKKDDRLFLKSFSKNFPSNFLSFLTIFFFTSAKKKVQWHTAWIKRGDASIISLPVRDKQQVVKTHRSDFITMKIAFPFVTMVKRRNRINK